MSCISGCLISIQIANSTFLAAADYQVELWLDGATPGEIRRQQQRLDADHRALVLDLDANGGAVARLVAPPLRIATTP